MKIPVTLNDKKIFFDAPPEKPLVDVLREMKILSPKKGCGKGFCGFCTVLLDNKAVNSCIIPVGLVKDCSIVTLEHFSKTDMYKDIVRGFKQAGLKLCGFCNAAKIFSTYELLQHSYRPSPEELSHIAEDMTCNCTDKDSFINGILYATANKHEREGRKNVL